MMPEKPIDGETLLEARIGKRQSPIGSLLIAVALICLTALVIAALKYGSEVYRVTILLEAQRQPCVQIPTAPNYRSVPQLNERF